jgi:hypothetical protein
MTGTKWRRVTSVQGLPSDFVRKGLLLLRSGYVGNLWFLNFLTCRKGLLRLARMRRASLLKVSGIGATYADAIQAWQSRAYFAPDASLVGDMIQQDAARILELKQQIKALEEQMAHVAESSSISPTTSPPSRAMAPSARPSWPAKSEPSSAFGARPAWPSISAWPRWTTAPASPVAQSRQGMSIPVPRPP